LKGKRDLSFNLLLFYLGRFYPWGTKNRKKMSIPEERNMPSKISPILRTMRGGGEELRAGITTISKLRIISAGHR